MARRSFDDMVLRVLGDTDDASDDLGALSAEVLAFDGLSAEADVDADTAEAEYKLARIQADMRKLAGQRATVTVDVDTTDLDRARRGLDGLDGAGGGGPGGSKRGGFLDSFSNRLTLILRLLPLVIPMVIALGAGLFGIAASGGAAAAALAAVGVAGGAVLGVLGAVAGAGVASFAQASDAMKEAETAAEAAASASEVTADAERGLAQARRDLNAAGTPAERKAAEEQVAAARRTLTQATKAETAAQEEANAAKREANRLGARQVEAIKAAASQLGNVTRGAGLAVLDGVAGALRNIARAVGGVQDEFTGLGRTVGGELQRVTGVLDNPFWQRFFRFLLRSAQRIVPMLGDSFVVVGRVFANITRGAMPTLIRGLRAVNGWLRGIARSTSDTGALREDFAALARHLRAVAGVLSGLGGLLVGIFRGGNEEIAEFTEWLAKSLRRLAAWANSAEGQERIAEFFRNVLPLAQSLLGLLGRLTETVLRFSELAAPGLDLFIDALNVVLDLVNTILDALRALPGPFGEIAATAASLIALGGFAAFKVAGLAGLKVFGKLLAGLPALIKGLPSLMSRVGAAGAGLVSRLSGLATGLGSRVLPLLGRFAPMLLRLAGPLGVAAGLFFTFKDEILDAVGFAWDGVKDFVGNIGDWLGSGGKVDEVVSTAIWARLRRTIRDTANTADVLAKNIKTGIAGAFRSTLPPARRASSAMRTAIRGVGANIRAVFGEVPRVVQRNMDLATDGVGDLRGKMRHAGRTLMRSFNQGIREMAPLIGNSIRGVGQQIANLLPGSEPKDSTSPLRGLGKRGEALVRNVARGMSREAPRMAAQLSRDLRVTADGIEGGRRGDDRRWTGDMHNHFTTPGGGNADPRAGAAQWRRRMRRRGFSIA